jgi:hypothetical protein
LIKTGKISLIFFIFFLFILLLTRPVLAQSVSNELYETEEDLKEGLENGDLTYDEYLELLDLIRSRVDIDSDDTTRLLFIPDVTSIKMVQRLEVEPRTLSPLNKSVPFIKLAPKRRPGLKGELVWQTYQKIEEKEKAENFFILKINEKRRFSFDLKAEQDELKRFETQKRSLRFFNLWRSTDVVLGNFEKRIGLGLNLGYHPLFRYSLDDTLNISNSFLYPISGRYNGILLESQFKFFCPGVIFSKNRFGDLEDELYALNLNFSYKRSKIGILFTKGKLRNSSTKSSFKDDCTSVYLDLFWKSLRLSSEYAQMWNNEKGVALNLNAIKKTYHISGYFWWYSSDFVHPHGGGISNPDYESIYILDDLDFSYRTRQKGEKGILFKSTYHFPTGLFFDFAFNQWRKNPVSDQSLKLKTGGGYYLNKNLLTELHLILSDNLGLYDTDYFNLSWDWVYSFVGTTYLRLRTNYRSKRLIARTKKYGDIQLKIGDFKIFPFALNLWLGYSDPDFSISRNSYWNVYLEERVYFWGRYSIWFKYLAKFYQSEEKENTQAIRVRWEMDW